MHTGRLPRRGGGNAIADVLFGDYNPAGRLPVTYYRSVDQLPPFEDYDMDNRTYEFQGNRPFILLECGLSCCSAFAYSDLVVPAKTVAGTEVKVSVTVCNIGKMTGDEVVQRLLSD